MLIITILYIYTIDNFIHFNLYRVDMCLLRLGFKN